MVFTRSEEDEDSTAERYERVKNLIREKHANLGPIT